MKFPLFAFLGLSAVLVSTAHAQAGDDWNKSQIHHVLLLSIDGMQIGRASCRERV